jgi:hypothetical protein
VTQEQDWTTGFILLAASVFFASLLFGFAHLVQDAHDIKRGIAVLASAVENDDYDGDEDGEDEEEDDYEDEEEDDYEDEEEDDNE